MYQYFNFVQFQLIAKKRVFIQPELLLGMSGGQDSNLLYLVTSIIGYQYNLKLFLVYCNHYWQKDSFITQQNLLRVAFLKKHSLSIFITFEKTQNEGRSTFWRYVSFQRISYFWGTSSLLIGHTSSDMIESFLFYLNRGSSTKLITQYQNINLNDYNKLNLFTVKKLKLINIDHIIVASSSSKQIKIIKPIETLNRYEVFKLIQFSNFPIWSDQTNFSMRYSRNRIRYQILPLIRFYFNPKLDVNIQRFINSFSNDILFLEYITSKLQNENMILIPEKSFRYHFGFFFSCPYLFQRRLLVKGLIELEIGEIKYRQIEYILKFLIIHYLKKRRKNKKIIFILNKKLRLQIFESMFEFSSIETFGSDGI